jgi:Protein of unknown function (DUF4019)
MRRVVFILLALLLALAPSLAAAEAKPVPAQIRAEQAALAWLALVDRADWAGSYASAHPFLRSTTDRAAWDLRLKEMRGDLGPILSRRLRTVEFSGDRPNPPKKTYYAFVYDTKTVKGVTIEEDVTCRADAAGVWRVSGYFVDLKLQ